MNVRPITAVVFLPARACHLTPETEVGSKKSSAYLFLWLRATCGRFGWAGRKSDGFSPRFVIPRRHTFTSGSKVLPQRRTPPRTFKYDPLALHYFPLKESITSQPPFSSAIFRFWLRQSRVDTRCPFGWYLNHCLYRPWRIRCSKNQGIRIGIRRDLPFSYREKPRPGRMHHLRIGKQIHFDSD
jgi:hypothetical protein